MILITKRRVGVPYSVQMENENTTNRATPTSLFERKQSCFKRFCNVLGMVSHVVSIAFTGYVIYLAWPLTSKWHINVFIELLWSLLLVLGNCCPTYYEICWKMFLSLDDRVTGTVRVDDTSSCITASTSSSTSNSTSVLSRIQSVRPPWMHMQCTLTL